MDGEEDDELRGEARAAPTDQARQTNQEEAPEVTSTTSTRILSSQISFDILKGFGITYEPDPDQIEGEDSVLANRHISEEELSKLREFTDALRKTRAEVFERNSQSQPFPSEPPIKRRGKVVVTEYDPPLEGGLVGTTKIGIDGVDSKILEGLGYTFAREDGHWVFQQPLSKDQIDEIFRGRDSLKNERYNIEEPRGAEGLEGISQPTTRSSIITKHDHEIIVIEYDPPQDGIRGITRIPKILTTSQTLENLGYYIYEVKDGLFELNVPLRESKIDQIIRKSKESQDGEQSRAEDVRQENIPVRGGPQRRPPRPYIEPDNYEDEDDIDIRIRRDRVPSTRIVYPEDRRYRAARTVYHRDDSRYRLEKDGGRRVRRPRPRSRSNLITPPPASMNSNPIYDDYGAPAYSPPRLTTSPDPLDSRGSRSDRNRFEFEQDRNRSRSRVLSPYRGISIERERDDFGRRSMDMVDDEIYEPPEREGKSLKFDVNLHSLASDINDNQATKAPRPNNPSSIGKPEILSIEASRRYTGDSGGETVVLTTGLKTSISQPGHLRWIHLEHEHMSFESLQQLLLQTEELDNDYMLIALQLLRKIQGVGGEGPSNHAYYQQPTVLRCDARDLGDGTKPDRTCTVVCFPYFSFQKAPSPSKKHDVRTHSARSLLQMLYYLDSTGARDMEQVIRKLRPTKGNEAIYESQLWAIVIGSDTLITYSTASLAAMRGDKILSRDCFFSRWINAKHGFYGYSMDECNLFLENDQKLEAPSWSAAIEAEKSPIVNIFVRFKDTRELADNEIDKAEVEGARRRYRADEYLYEGEPPVPPTLRKTRARDISHSYEDERRPAMSKGERDILRQGSSTDERPRDMRLIKRTGEYSQDAGEDYHPRRGPMIMTPSRMGTKDGDLAFIVRVRSQNLSRDRLLTETVKDARRRDTKTPYIYRKSSEDTELIRYSEHRDRYKRKPVRDIVIRRRDRDSSPLQATRKRRGPRYHGGGVISNESQSIGQAKIRESEIYYIPEEKPVRDLPTVNITQDENNQSKPVYSAKASIIPELPDKRSPSGSSKRVPPAVEPSVPPILMWPIGRANPTTKHDNPGPNGVNEQQDTNESSIVDLLDRVYDQLLLDQYYDHGHLFLEFDEATRQDPLFQSIYSEQLANGEGLISNSTPGRSPAQPATTAEAVETSSPLDKAATSQQIPQQGIKVEHDTTIRQFCEIAIELLDAFLPANYPSPVAGKYYGAMKKIIKLILESHDHYFMREGKQSPEMTVYTIHNVLDPDYALHRNIKPPRLEFSSCDECSNTHIYRFETEALEHLRQVHFRPENESSDTPSTAELKHWIKRVYRLNIERQAEEQLRVLTRCCQHLFNLQTASREIRDGVSTDDKAHQARYRLPKALVESFQRLVMLLIYAFHVLELISKNCDRSASSPWEYEDDLEYTTAYDHMVFIGMGAEVNMERGKLDLLQMIRLEDYTQSVSYEAVGPEYILSMVMQNLQGGLNCTDLVDVYKEWAKMLAYQVSLRPRKRLLRDFQHLSEEIKVLHSTLYHQHDVLEDFRRCLVPNSFRTTTETRVSMYAIEEVLLLKICDTILHSWDEYEEIDYKVERLVSQTKMSIEILDDDHGKAIFVFTVVTLIFLPLSFVASLLGMNTIDIRNQDTTQWLFWAIGLPITAIVVVLALVVAYRYDEMREWIDKKMKKEPAS